MDQQDEIFKALADSSRRLLLDKLFQQDGQTLSDLCGYLPEMSRFGVMKHLQVLQDAGLITTQKVGRSKHHYLNAVPIQIVYDRWVSKYAQPWAQTLVQLKNQLETEGETKMVDHPDRIFQTYIRTTPERLWQALTDGTITSQYYFGTRVESTWEVGAAYHYIYPNGGVMVEGKITEIDPPKKLVTTFVPKWVDADRRPEETIVTWEIVPKGDVCELTLTHKNLDPASPMTLGVSNGWAQILSGLKTYLETGEVLVIQN